MPHKPLYILGLCYFGNHGSSAALLRDGVCVAFEEGAGRAFPLEAVQHCLKAAGISIGQVDRVAFFWQPWRGILLRIWYALLGLPGSLERGSQNAGVLFDLLRARSECRRQTGYRGPFYFVDHHHAHAAHAFYTSGFKHAAILTVDGTGETKTCWLGESDGKIFTEHRSVKWPHSLGHVYAAITEYLGFESFKEERKVVELAQSGRPTHLEQLRKIITSTPTGSFAVDLRYFNYHLNRAPRYSPLFAKTFEGSSPADLAASLQTRVEEVLIELASYAVEKSGSKNLCLAGGVAHNALAVERLQKSGVAEQVYIPSHPGDTGTALGAALYLYHHADISVRATL